MRKFRIGHAIPLLFCLMAAVGCGRSGEATGSFSTPMEHSVFVDDTGETLVLTNSPRRVVSVAPSLTEIVAAVGKDSTLVGVTMHCDHPERVSSVPKIGSYVKPNIEAIVAARPDLVLMVEDGPPAESIRELRRIGLKVAVLRTTTFRDIVHNVRWIGAVLGADSAGEKVASKIEADYRAIKSVVSDANRPKALYAIAIDPVITVGRGSFLHELLVDAGAENIAGDLEASYPRMTLEAVIARRPERIIFSGGMGSEANAAAQKGYWRRWPELPAVRSGQLLEIDAGLINRPSPRIAMSLAALATLLHPEQRGEIEAATASQNPSARAPQ